MAKRLLSILFSILFILAITGNTVTELNAKQTVSDTLSSEITYAHSDRQIFTAGRINNISIHKDIPAAKSGTWKKDSNGWWYDYGNGKYPKNELLKIGSSAYYFNGSGYMVTGWLKLSEFWYYFTGSGAMAQGWQSIGGSWYFFSSEGNMITGLQTISGKKYYLESSGRMATGWKRIGSSWYYFNSSGAMAVSQWAGDYYLKNDGTMAVNEWVDSHKYYVGSDGKWIPGYGTPQWKSDSNGWWYDNGDGTYPKSEWKTIGGVRYYFKSSGYMATGWQKIGSDWYYFDSSGRLLTNQWVDGYYYVGTDGIMATNTWIGNYYVDGSGRWVQTRSGTSYNYFVKSKNSKKFHHPNCPEVSKIKASNLEVHYKTKQEMIALGYEPCKVCEHY